MVDEFVIPYGALAEALGSVPLFIAVMLLWLVVLFYVLYAVTEKHFIVALGGLSTLLRLSPDIAGLTLLAMGNGAPDFFTAVFAAEKQFGMILGSAVGSGLFILTVVFGLVIFFAGDQKTALIASTLPESSVVLNAPRERPKLSKRALIRNASVYMFSLALISLMIALQRVPLWLCAALPSAYVAYMVGTLAEYFVRRRRTMSPVKGESPAPDLDVVRTESVDEKGLGIELRRYIEWPSAGDDFLILRKTGAIVSAVFAIPLTLTIPPLNYDGRTPRLNRMRCLVLPFFALPLLAFLALPEQLVSDWWTWGVVFVSSTLLCGLLYVSTSETAPPRFAAMHPIGAFVMCVAWIYVACNEIVAALTSMGETLEVSPVVLGVLVLAWGNSFGDLIANVAVSHRGGFETAVSAVFCGPIQNTLLTLGVAFIIGAVSSPGRVLVIDVGMTVLVPLCVLIGTVVMSVLVILLLFKCRVPHHFGLLLVSIYVLYLPVALFLALFST